jgi:hypothetical protein
MFLPNLKEHAGHNLNATGPLSEESLSMSSSTFLSRKEALSAPVSFDSVQQE